MTTVFERLETAFQAARRLPPGTEREAVLASTCGDDAGLRTEVDLLLAEHDATSEAAWDTQAESLRRRLEADLAQPEIAGFEIIETLGQGAAGTVYRAVQAQPHREVALKVLHPEAATTALRRRFEREAEALARLAHPGIARIHDQRTVQTDRGPRSYIVMELVEGTHLDQWVHEKGPPLERRLELLAELCEAMAHAHEAGVMHRDLKPSNVLVTAAGRVTVLDFGIAVLEDGVTRRTRAGEILGTLGYMSPEQALGIGTSDTRSDVYALGVLCYEVLCGEPPYRVEGQHIAAAVHTIANAPVVPLGSRDATLRGDIGVVVAKAMSRDRGRRYPTAAALAEDLRRIRDQEPILARPPTATYQVQMFVRRNKVLVAGVLATLLAMIAGTVAALHFASRAGHDRALAERARTDTEFVARVALLRSAQAELRDGDPAAARAHLNQVPEGLRGWAWRLLDTSLDESVSHTPATFVGGPCSDVTLRSDGHSAVVSPCGSGAYRLDVDGARPELTMPGTDSPAGCAAHVGMHTLLGGPWPSASGAETAFALVLLDADGRRERVVQLAERPLALHADLRSGILAVVTGAPRGRKVIALRLHRIDMASGDRQMRTLRGAEPSVRVGPGGDDIAIFGRLTDAPSGSTPASGEGWAGARIYRGTAMTRIDLGGHVANVHSLAFGRHGRAVLTGSRDHAVVLNRLSAGGEPHVLPDPLHYRGHRRIVRAVALGPAGRVAATAANDGVIHLWDAVTGAAIRTLSGHDGGVRALAFVGRDLVSFGGDGLRRWDLREDRLATRLRPQPDAVENSACYAVAWSPRGDRIHAGTLRGHAVLDARTGRARARTLGVSARFGVVLSSDGERALVCGVDLALVDAGTGTVLSRAPLPEGNLRGASWHPDGRRLIAWGSGGAWWLDDALRPVGEKLDVGGNVMHVVFAPAGEWMSLICRSPGGRPTVKVAKVLASGALEIQHAHRGGRPLVMGPGGDRIAFKRGDDVHIVQVISGRTLAVLPGAGHTARSFALMEDGTLLAVGTRAATVRIWDVAVGRELLLLRAGERDIESLAFSPDATSLAAALLGSSDGRTVRVWSTQPASERHAVDQVVRKQEDRLRVRIAALRDEGLPPKAIEARLRLELAGDPVALQMARAMVASYED